MSDSKSANYKIIVFEGNELVGKSTLKKQLEIKTNFRHLCVDRMFATSIIYNAFKGRHSDLHKQLTEDLESFIKCFDPLFVVVKANLDTQMLRYDKRGEWYIKKEELEALNKAYDDLAATLVERWPANFIVVENNTEEDIEKNLKLIEEHLKDLMSYDTASIHREKPSKCVGCDYRFNDDDDDSSISMRG
jgi:thymidylate kinase